MDLADFSVFPRYDCRNIAEILCHASIVAREYKIPCIVSAKNVTKSIKDGSTIYMNGETGEIEWVSD